MLNKKLKRLIYELTKNSRIKTKDLGKRVMASQQSTSYLLSSLRKNKVILENNTIFDPAKFGYVNILVYYNFSDFSSKIIGDIISFLQKEDSVVNIERLGREYDLACIFCVPNLSNFNKTNKEFLRKFRKNIFVVGIFPIVVTHIYSKKYLISRPTKVEEVIIRGDRDVIEMSKKEKKIAKLLYGEPNIKIVDIARKTNLNPKTIIKIKSKLEENKIIRGYSVLLNYKKLDIDRKQILINTEELELKEDTRLLYFSKYHSNIVRLTKLIGEYDVLIEVEGENLTKKDVLQELRVEFGIKKFKILEGDSILKEKYIPKNALE